MWDERYENYSLLSYRDYGLTREAPQYDPFGMYLVDGQQILVAREFRTIAPNQGSQTSWNLVQFRNMVIMNENFGGWGTRFMMGDVLDGYFSPLTLNMARLDGFRWDASSHRNRFSTVVSRLPRMPSAGSQSKSSTRDLSYYLFGGHWESNLGDAVTFGATYVNFHLEDARQRDSSFRGTFPSTLQTKKANYVIVSDDSPEDGLGPKVFAIRLLVNGIETDIEPQIRRLPGELVTESRGRKKHETFTVAADQVAHIRQDGAWAPNIPDAQRKLNNDFFSWGIPVVAGRGPLQVTGTDLLIYRYDLPEETEDVRFLVQVSGDYSIDVGATYEGLSGQAGPPSLADWHNVARAPGNVKDGSNMGWVTVRYGFPTGLATWGSNLTVRLPGATLDAEYVLNNQHFQFPFGDRHERSADAYHVRLSRKTSDYRVGFEYVDFPADFATSLPIWSPGANKMIPWHLVDDNDDRDEWQDVGEHWDVLDPLYTSGVYQDPETQVPAGTRDYGMTGDSGAPGALGGAPGHGVFPGLDLNDDGTPDVNINRNQLPDYAEPFFMYFTDPEEFVYGDDFNNNGIVDLRENDNKPDYPYDRDQRGYHAMVGFGFLRGVDVRLGRYHMRQRIAEGENEANYAEFRSTFNLDETGRLSLNYRIRRVRDDIPNPVYQHTFDQGTRARVSYRLLPDDLLMRNSLVNTVFLEAEYTGVSGLNFINAVKYERNGRRDEGEGIGGDVREFTLMSKADYAYQRGEWTLTPMTKLLMLHRDGPGQLLAPQYRYDLFPIFKVDYKLSDRTVLRAGVQGLPGFQHRHRNMKAAAEDFDARHYLGLIQTTGNYTGYDVAVNLGFRTSRSRFINLPHEPVERLTEFFLQAYML